MNEIKENGPVQGENISLRSFVNCANTFDLSQQL